MFGLFDSYMHGYELCQDTVSVYHYDGGSVSKTVFDKAYLDNRKTESVGRTGGTEENGFLLVIPGPAQACHIGDKVMLGSGVDVPSGDANAWWRSFIPSKVDGLVVVKTVDVKRFGGRIVHTEASG